MLIIVGALLGSSNSTATCSPLAFKPRAASSRPIEKFSSTTATIARPSTFAETRDPLTRTWGRDPRSAEP